MERIKLIGTVIAIVLAVIIVMVNWESQDFNLLVTTINMPLAVMLFGTLAIGYLSGMIVGNPLRFLRKKSS